MSLGFFIWAADTVWVWVLVFTLLLALLITMLGVATGAICSTWQPHRGHTTAFSLILPPQWEQNFVGAGGSAGAGAAGDASGV